MASAKHTQGEWKIAMIEKTELNRFKTHLLSGPLYLNLVSVVYGDSKKELLANARLIAEAGNVANESGLTPRQLLEQRNELLEALIEAREKVAQHTTLRLGSGNEPMFPSLLSKIDKTISKAKGK